MAYIIFLVGNGYCPLTWKANKIVRVVKSTLTAEALSLLAGLDEAMYLQQMILDLFPDIPLPVYAKVDNKASMRESVQNGLVESISWIETKDQLADCMTKKGVSGERFMFILQTGSLDTVFLM